MNYDCVIIGGGIAGLQAAIQLGRYRHNILVLDEGNGRSTLCRSYHNLLGYPNGVSGLELREIGRKQSEALGVDFFEGKAELVENIGHSFIITTQDGLKFKGKRLLLATGLMDRLPPFPNLLPCLGISVYVCPDCDGYEIQSKKVAVIGSGQVGVNMALTLSYWTNDIININHELAEISPELLTKLQEKHIQHIDQPIKELLTDGEQFRGIILKDQTEIPVEHAFIAFGKNEVKSGLAKQLGVELLENKHIITDSRTKMTNVKHVWAAGDVGAHSEQVTIAMGEGAQAAIWIHKSLMNE